MAPQRPHNRYKAPFMVLCLLIGLLCDAKGLNPVPSLHGPAGLAPSSRFALGLLATLGATWSTVLAWLVNGMRCDDGCTRRDVDPGRGWRSYSDGWQYDAQLTAALVSLTCAVADLRSR
jgi:hypothetical protein